MRELESIDGDVNQLVLATAQHVKSRWGSDGRGELHTSSLVLANN